MVVRMSENEGGLGRRLFVVANGSRGRGYLKRLGESGYEAIMTWDTPAARARDAELGADRPGRVFPAAHATARSAVEHEGEDSPKMQAKREHAHRIAEDIAAGFKAGRFDSVILIAPAGIAAGIREHLPHPLHAKVIAEEHHDYTGLPLSDLFPRLDALRYGR